VAELSGRDYDTILDLTVAAIERLDGDGSWWQPVCEGLIGTLEAGIAGVLEVTLPDGIISGETWPQWTQGISFEPPGLVVRHPLVRHYSTRHDTEPRTISDVQDRHGWRRSPVYRRVLTTMQGSAVHQLAIPLPGPRHMFRSIALGRSDGDFTEHHRQFARRLQPLLVTLDRHVRAARRWQVTAPPGAAARAADVGLTSRELTVLGLVADGLTGQAIARRLGITAHTVAKHQQNIYRKFGTGDRLTTVLVAGSLGLLPFHEACPVR